MRKNKKLVIFVLVGVMLIINSAFTVLADENQSVQIMLDGYLVDFDVAPIILDGRTLVPFRAIAEALNVTVSWNDTTKTVTAENADIKVKLQIGSNEAYKNNNLIMLDVAPQIIESRTLIPLRFFTEAFNCGVEWDEAEYKVRITSPKKKMHVMAYYALGDINTSSWTDLFGKAYPVHSAGNTDKVSTLELGWYSVDINGNLLTKSRTGWQRPDGWETVISTAAAYKLAAEMVVHVTDGDNTITDLLSSDTAIDNAVRSIAREAALYQGVNLDFEGLGLSQKGDDLLAVQQQFTAFVNKLRGALEESKTLTLSLHPLNSAFKGYDYNALGDISDKIVLMAYDYGMVPESEALVIQAIEQALEVVPKNKLILGISVPNETAESVKIKIGLAKRYELDGIALWRLGLLDESTWQALSDSIVAVK